MCETRILAAPLEAWVHQYPESERKLWISAFEVKSFSTLTLLALRRTFDDDFAQTQRCAIGPWNDHPWWLPFGA